MNRTDPSQNFMARYPQRLDPLFYPQVIGVIGAKDDAGTVGCTIMSNLLSGGFQGRIYPINPKREKVMGLKCYPAVADLPESLDLAVIVTPAKTVPSLVAQCTQTHTKTAIVISAGFKELGGEGVALEEEMLHHARQGGLAVIGPNCLGVMNPLHHLNATFARGMALPGKLAFISQSGAMCTAVLDWSLQENIGFSAFVSIGSMGDVGWGALIDYLGGDPHTESLLLYMETIGDARAFLSAAREVALEKPIIAIKAGRTQAAAKAAASHTGSLAGSDEVFDAALERVGVLRVGTIGELFHLASALDKQPRPKGPRLAIVTNAGGPAVLATDAAILSGAEMAPLASETIQRLDEVLPPAWSHANPVDLLGDATAARYAQAVERVIADPNTDGTLVILSPQDMTDPTGVAEAIAALPHNDHPLLASWMGGASVEEGVEVLTDARIPQFNYPDEAAKTFALMWQYSRELKTLYETPGAESEGWRRNHQEEKKAVTALLEKLRAQNRTLLTEFEAKEALGAYQIPIVETDVATDCEAAVLAADKIGYPVVLKLLSETITHKTDVGGVHLNLSSPSAVREAFAAIQERIAPDAFQGVTVQRMVRSSGYELILGSSTDPQFGPVLLFGTGGQLVEVYKDRALGLPPLNLSLARQLMEKTKVYEALQGVRGRTGVDLQRLGEILVQFSRLVAEHPRIREIDINPLLAGDREIVALDARIVLHPFEIPDNELPRLAIRPYPASYVREVTLKDGTAVLLRPIRPEDEPLLHQFHRELSAESVRQRFFEFVSLDERVAHERLVRICFNDYDREWALVADVQKGAQRAIVGIGRLSRIPGTPHAQLKMAIVDPFQGRGLGTALLKRLLSIAEQERVEVVDAHILAENRGMLHLCQKFGFTLAPDEGTGVVHAQWKP